MKKTLQLIKSFIFFAILTLPSQVMGLDNGLIEERCYEKPLLEISEIWKIISPDKKMLSSIVENKKLIAELSHAIQIKNPVKAEINDTTKPNDLLVAPQLTMGLTSELISKTKAMRTDCK